MMRGLRIGCWTAAVSLAGAASFVAAAEAGERGASPVAYQMSIESFLSRGDVKGVLTPFFCFPTIDVTEQAGSADPFVGTDAFVTLASPNNLSREFENNPSGAITSGSFRTTQQDLLDEINGVWRVTIEEVGGAVWQYEVPIALVLPVAELRRVASDSVVQGAEFAPPFGGRVEAEDAVYPGPNAGLEFLMRTSTGGFIERQLLPGPMASWTPMNGIPMGDDEVQIDISTRQEATETDS